MTRDDGIDRRRVLKGITAGTAALGASGIATADRTATFHAAVSDDAVTRYADPDVASEVLSDHRDDVESMLGEDVADAFEQAAIADVAVGHPVDLDVGPSDDVAVISAVDTPHGRSPAIHVYLDLDAGDADFRITAIPDEDRTRYFAWGRGDALGDAIDEDVSTSTCYYCCGCSCCGYPCLWNCCSSQCCIEVPDSSCEETGSGQCCL